MLWKNSPEVNQLAWAQGHPSLAGQGIWVNWIPAALQPCAQALGCLSSPLSMSFKGAWLTPPLPSAWFWRCQPEHRATSDSCHLPWQGSSVTSSVAWSLLTQLRYLEAWDCASTAFQHPKARARQYFFPQSVPTTTVRASLGKLLPCLKTKWAPNMCSSFFSLS